MWGKFVYLRMVVGLLHRLTSGSWVWSGAALSGPWGFWGLATGGVTLSGRLVLLGVWTFLGRREEDVWVMEND